MRAALYFGLFLSVIIGGEAVYRWSNALELSWSWLGSRSAMLATVVLVSTLESRSRQRRERGGRGAGSNGIGWPLFSLVLAGGGVIVWTWRVIGALITGRMEVSTSPEIYTSWSSNPVGFMVAMGLALLGVVLLLIWALAAALMLWNAIRARHGPAWP